MALSWCRIKQAQLRALSNQFKCYYFQIHGNSSLIQQARIGAVNSPNMISHKTGADLGMYVRYFAAPVQVKPKYEEKDKDNRPRMNEEISAPYVRLVTDEGHGVVSRNEALDRARSLNLDLVEVHKDAKTPVCKLMDYNKERYAKQAKEKELTKKKTDVVLRKGSMKEVRIASKITANDLQTKADGVKRLTERGHRVKCMAIAPPVKKEDDKDDEMLKKKTKEELGVLLSRFASLIDEFTLVESGPIIEAKQAYIVVRHMKFGPLKKGPGKKNVSKMIKSQNPESSDQNLEESGSETEDDTFCESIEENSPAETSNTDTAASENRYASKRPTNTSGPGPDNRYANGPRPDNRYANGPRPDNLYANGPRPDNRYAKGTGPDNRYATTRPGSGPGPDNRYAATRAPYGSDPGARRRLEPESQNPGQVRHGGPSEANNENVRENEVVNRYKKATRRF